MKKVVNALLISVLCMFCLTGCMRFNTSVTVKPNGKFDISMLYAVMDMTDSDSEAFSEEDLQEYIDEGWTVEEYNQDNYYGIILSKENASMEELIDTVEDTQSDLSSEASSFNISREGLKYVIDWQVFSPEEAQEMAAYKTYFAMYGGYMSMSITLPVKPTSSNATFVSEDGKTLEWDLLNLGIDQRVHVEFSLINKGLIIGICVAVAVVLLLIIFLVAKASKKKKAAAQAVTPKFDPMTGQPIAPAQPMQPQFQQPMQPQFQQPVAPVIQAQAQPVPPVQPQYQQPVQQQFQQPVQQQFQQPVQPTAPVQPVQPVAPTQPEQPVVPEQSQPAEPVIPEQTQELTVNTESEVNNTDANI